MIISTEYWDTGDVSKWEPEQHIYGRNSGLAVVESANPLRKYHLQSHVEQAGGFAVVKRLENGDISNKATFMRVYTKFDALPTLGCSFHFFDIRELNDYRLVNAMLKNDNGDFKWRMDYWERTGWNYRTVLSTPFTPQIDRYYLIEIGVYFSPVGNNGWAEMWVDGVLVCEASGFQNEATSFQGRSCVGLGVWDVDCVVNAYFDCIVVADSPIGSEMPHMITLATTPILVPINVDGVNYTGQIALSEGNHTFIAPNQVSG